MVHGGKLIKYLEEAKKKFVEDGNQALICITVYGGNVKMDGDGKNFDDVMAGGAFETIQDIMLSNKNSEVLEYKSSILPKLMAPLDIENKDKWWTTAEIRGQVRLYFTILRWKKSCGKPNWWPKSLSFDKYHQYSYSSMRHLKIIL